MKAPLCATACLFCSGYHDPGDFVDGANRGPDYGYDAYGNLVTSVDLFIYVSNETLKESQYYPFGPLMAGIGAQAAENQ